MGHTGNAGELEGYAPANGHRVSPNLQGFTLALIMLCHLKEYRKVLHVNANIHRVLLQAFAKHSQAIVNLRSRCLGIW